MCLPGCCGTRTGAKIAAIYTMMSGAWYGIQAIFAFTDTLVIDALHGLDGVLIFLVSCIVLCLAGVVLMSGARQLSRAKVVFWLIAFGTMLSVRIVYLGLLVAEIRYEEHDVHRVFQLLGPTIMTTIFLLADLWSSITVIQFLRDLRANRYIHKQTFSPATSASLAKSVFAWNDAVAAGSAAAAAGRGGGGGAGGFPNNTDSSVLTAAQLGHLPPALQKAYAAAMANGRPFTTKDYQYLMMQYDIFESSQQLQQHQQQQQQNQQQQLRQQQQPFSSRPLLDHQQQHIPYNNNLSSSNLHHMDAAAAQSYKYDLNVNSGGGAPVNSSRYTLQQQQQQAAALRRLHRDSLYARGDSNNGGELGWNYMAPALTAGYLAVQCMDSAFDADMGSALAAVDI